jgi:hypothetical protein
VIEHRTGGRRLGASAAGALLVASLAILVFAPQAAASKANPSQCDRREKCPKPDLVVKSISADRPFVVRGRPGETVKLNYAIENSGRGNAGPSKTRLLLKSDVGQFAIRTNQDFPKLGPGKSDGKKATPRLDGEVAIERYRLIACADTKNEVAEANEKNNCKRGRFVTVVPWKLVGEVTGEYIDPDTEGTGVNWRESWTGSNVTFETTPGQKQPNYFPTGVLDYQISGTGNDPRCTVSGGGPIPLDVLDGHLTLALDLKSFSAVGTLDFDAQYEYTEDCPNEGPVPIAGPRSGNQWLLTNQAQSTGFGPGNFPTELVGVEQFLGAFGETLTYSWNLRVE